MGQPIESSNLSASATRCKSAAGQRFLHVVVASGGREEKASAGTWPPGQVARAWLGGARSDGDERALSRISASAKKKPPQVRRLQQTFTSLNKVAH